MAVSTVVHAPARFYINQQNSDRTLGWIPVEGIRVEIPHLSLAEFFVWQESKSLPWQAAEVSTGGACGGYSESFEEAVTQLQTLLRPVTRRKFWAAYEGFVLQYFGIGFEEGV